MNRSAGDLSVSQLGCFVAVVEAGSLAQAGRRLGMSAASVSKALLRLEASTGVRLLHRSTHALSLTDEGEVLLASARAVLSAARDFQDLASGAADADEAGTIRISAPVALTRSVIAPLVSEFRLTHPRIRLDVRATNEIVDLADDGIDIALRSGPLARVPGHVQQRWFSFAWIICASMSYLDGRSRPGELDELAGHDCIGFRNGRTGQVSSWPIRDQAGESTRYVPDAALVFDDGDSAWSAALAGAGIACAPLWLADEALRNGTMVELLHHRRDRPVDVALIRRERRLTPARVGALLRFLSDRAPIYD